MVMQGSLTERWHTETLQCRNTYRKMEHCLKPLGHCLEAGDILMWCFDPNQQLSTLTATYSLPLLCPSRAERQKEEQKQENL